MINEPPCQKKKKIFFFLQQLKENQKGYVIHVRIYIDENLLKCQQWKLLKVWSLIKASASTFVWNHTGVVVWETVKFRLCVQQFNRPLTCCFTVQTIKDFDKLQEGVVVSPTHLQLKTPPQLSQPASCFSKLGSRRHMWSPSIQMGSP